MQSTKHPSSSAYDLGRKDERKEVIQYLEQQIGKSAAKGQTLKSLAYFEVQSWLKSRSDLLT